MPGDVPRIEELSLDELYALLDDGELDHLGELHDKGLREALESIDRRHVKSGRVVDELVALRRELATSATVSETQDDDVHPRSKPDPYSTATFWKAVALLIEGEDLTVIAGKTGLSYNKVVKIRDWHAHPGQLGPNGSPGYRLYPGETSATLVLRKLRKPR